MRTAFEALARLTSLGVIAPTPAWMTRMSTSSFESDSHARAQRFDRALTVGFEDEVEHLLPPSAGIDMNVSSETRCDPPSRRCARRDAASARFAAASRATRSSQTTISVSPADGTSESPMTSTGIDGPAFLHLLALVVDRARGPSRTSPPTTTMSPTRSVPFCTSTVATAPRAAIERRFDDDAGRAAIAVGLEFAHVGFEQHRFEQLVDAVAGACGDGDHFDRAAPLDRLQTLFGELLLDAVGLRVWLIHLVDRDDDRHVGGFDVS